MKQHNVGDVLFVLTERKNIEPVRVVEKITKQTMKGNTVQHVVVTTGKQPSGATRRFNLEDLPDRSIFENEIQLQNYLLAEATRVINELTKKALDVAQQEFGYQPPVDNIAPDVTKSMYIPGSADAPSFIAGGEALLEVPKGEGVTTPAQEKVMVMLDGVEVAVTMPKELLDV